MAAEGRASQGNMELAVVVMACGGCNKANFPRSLILQVPAYENTSYLLNTTSVFDRCSSNLDAVKPVKYKRDLNSLASTATRFPSRLNQRKRFW